MQVIRRLHNSERQCKICDGFNLSTSTIKTIPKNNERIVSPAITTTIDD